MRDKYEAANELRKFVGEDGTRFFNWGNFRGNWCALSTSYFFREVLGYKDFPISTTVISGSNAIEKVFADHINRDFSTAEPWDIITFENNGDPYDGADHVGVCIENTGSSIRVIEGNTGGSDWDDSTVHIYTYSYNNPILCHCIDMSWLFDSSSAPKAEAKTEQVKTEEPKVVTPEKKYTAEFKQVSLGSKGNFVQTVQYLLNAFGYGIKEDGVFGEATKEAVIAFQKKYNLATDGIVGKDTFSALVEN